MRIVFFDNHSSKLSYITEKKSILYLNLNHSKNLHISKTRLKIYDATSILVRSSSTTDIILLTHITSMLINTHVLIKTLFNFDCVNTSLPQTFYKTKMVFPSIFSSPHFILEFVLAANNIFTKIILIFWRGRSNKIPTIDHIKNSYI